MTVEDNITCGVTKRPLLLRIEVFHFLTPSAFLADDPDFIADN